jgi:putative protease
MISAKSKAINGGNVPQLLVNPISLGNAKALIKKKVDQISVGLKKFSNRNACCLTISQILQCQALAKSTGTKIIVLVNKIFFEDDLPELTKHLLELNQHGLTNVIFADYAVPQIIYENKLKFNLTYHPETLVVNYGQFDFYLDNKINQVVLARELNLLNIQEIAKNKNKMQIQVQVGGYGYMMQSR